MPGSPLLPEGLLLEHDTQGPRSVDASPSAWGDDCILLVVVVVSGCWGFYHSNLRSPSQWTLRTSRNSKRSGIERSSSPHSSTPSLDNVPQEQLHTCTSSSTKLGISWGTNPPQRRTFPVSYRAAPIRYIGSDHYRNLVMMKPELAIYLHSIRNI